VRRSRRGRTSSRRAGAISAGRGVGFPGESLPAAGTTWYLFSSSAVRTVQWWCWRGEWPDVGWEGTPEAGLLLSRRRGGARVEGKGRGGAQIRCWFRVRAPLIPTNEPKATGRSFFQ
jgi:hypothetical protein